MQKYPGMIGRTSLLSFENISSVETLQKVIGENYVILIDRQYAQMILTTWPHIAWHNSIEGFPAMYQNYAMKQKLQHNKKNVLSKL